VDWSRFASWEQFLQVLRERPGYRLQDTQRRRRKVQREIGTLRFVVHDGNPAVFEQCVRWKSAQYVATGFKDLFADKRNVELFRELLRRDLLTISALYAGERLGAVHLGVIFEGRFYSWVPVYDPQLHQYALGRLLLEEILAYSYRAGHAQFDFSVGGEPYKFCYATHVRVVEPAGKRPISLAATRAAKRGVKTVLTRFPGVWQWTEPLRRALR
jgi:CelD/BcsL family acetyltransferase involved in cellulose biosynthesis